MKNESIETIDFKNLKPDLYVKKNGYDYVLIKNGKRAIIYEQIISKDVKRYEVSLMRIKNAREFKGKQFPSKIWFPNDEAFGTWAWTFMTLESALWRFNELEQGKGLYDFTKPNTNIKKYSRR